MEKIGIVGLGRMGSAMARRYADEGWTVRGWTRSGRGVDGVPGAADLAALTAQSDVLVLSLLDDAAVAETLDALLGLPLGGKLIVETSTVVPAMLGDRLAGIEAQGGMAVDAPVSGGPELVLAGQAGIFIGGADAAATRASTALAPLSGRIFHVGPPGTGLVMKTINNAMLQTYITSLADMARLAKRAGLPLETALTILCGGPAGVPMVRDRLPKILGPDSTVGFPIDAAVKDADVFKRIARQFDVETPMLALAEAAKRGACERGLGEADVATLVADAYARA